ncbi:MAG TPA: M1 family aminopeptidase, partial [Chitinophagaceae bacterium]|nr:M1 family aminopeptidase [Chitinophagaceae bacterium]
NESFANYSETLWDEYKYGKDAGAAQNYNDMQGYLGSGSQDKNLVRFYYHDKEDMFDAVSYNKGGRILHMLRNYVGDSAFFKALNLYLTTNKFRSAEAHQLRLAFEEITGKDLNWYWNQWYYGSGHPELTIGYAYDDNAKKVTVTINQTQAGDKVFILPVAIDIYNGQKKVRHNIWVKNKEEAFSFAYTTRPDLVNVDADKILLCVKKDDKTLDNFIHQYKYAGNYVDRREAIDACAAKQQYEPKALDLLKLALKDDYFGLRKYALGKLDIKNPAVRKSVETILADLAQHDPQSTVRAEAIALLGEYDNKVYEPLFLAAISDSSYSVAGAGLEALTVVNTTLALAEMRKIKDQPAKGRLAGAVSQLLMAGGSEEDFETIAGNFEDLPMGDDKLEALQPFSQYLAKVSDPVKFKKGVDMIVAVRNAIPSAYQAQLAPYINSVILNGIITQKSKELKGNNAAAVKEQIDYVKSKIN